MEQDRSEVAQESLDQARDRQVEAWEEVAAEAECMEIVQDQDLVEVASAQVVARKHLIRWESLAIL